MTMTSSRDIGGGVQPIPFRYHPVEYDSLPSVRAVNTRLSQPTTHGKDKIILSAKSLAMQPPALMTVRHPQQVHGTSRRTQASVRKARSAQGHSKRDTLHIASTAGEESF